MTQENRTVSNCSHFENKDEILFVSLSTVSSDPFEIRRSVDRQHGFTGRCPCCAHPTNSDTSHRVSSAVPPPACSVPRCQIFDQTNRPRDPPLITWPLVPNSTAPALCSRPAGFLAWSPFGLQLGWRRTPGFLERYTKILRKLNESVGFWGWCVFVCHN